MEHRCYLLRSVSNDLIIYRGKKCLEKRTKFHVNDYCRLSGLSPFMGDTDIETMANVTIAKYDFDHEAFAEISEDAKDFIRCLLVKDKE